MAPSPSSSTTTIQSPALMIGSVSTESTVTLIPGLPNDVASLVLSMIPYAHHSRLRPTCKSWNHFLSSTETLINRRLRHVSHTRSQLLCLFPQDPSISSPYLFDPHHRAWLPLPPMPCNPYVYGLCNFASLSIGPHLYVLGGSVFDTRSFPMDRPSPTSSAFRFDFVTFDWARLSPMRSPRGSFACAAIPELGRIIVAGGGSRHTLFAAAGSRMSSVEVYDVERNEWVSMDGLPRYRAGCVGFVKEREFWVMGGYGESRTVSGLSLFDEYYKDVVVMDLGCGGGWREVGDMWRDGERARLGKIVVVDDYDDDEECAFPWVFMLDNDEIFRLVLSSVNDK